MIEGLFGSYNDPRDEKDEVEHYCKNCGMEEVEENIILFQIMLKEELNNPFF